MNNKKSGLSVIVATIVCAGLLVGMLSGCGSSSNSSSDYTVYDAMDWIDNNW